MDLADTGSNVDMCILLILNANSSQTNEVETKADSVHYMLESNQPKADKVHDMLKEIHDWYRKNLKAAKTATPITTVFTAKAAGAMPDLDLLGVDDEPQLRFEVHVQLPYGYGTSLICPRASFERYWLAYSYERPSTGIFRCNCRGDVDADELKFSSVWVDHSKDLQFSCTTPAMVTLT
jgi:hypothetical protein